MHLRTTVWTGCLLAAALLCGTWAALPALESYPLVRIALFLGTGVPMLGLVFCFPDLADRDARRLILAAALLLRLVLLPSPVSDDVNRYLWEGYLVLSEENPYAATADDPRWTGYRDGFWEAMNHRDRPTAYPPGIQWLAAGAVAVAYHPISFKALALLGDIVTLLLLLALVRREHLPIRWVGFYAFNPIVLTAFAAEAHFDSLMVAALLGALYASGKSQTRRAWLWLGVAVQIKLVAVLLVPLLLTRRTVSGLWVFALVLVLPSLPFAPALGAWWQGVTGFAGTSAFNGPLFTLLSLPGTPPEIVRPICSVIFLLGFAAVLFARFRHYLPPSACTHATLTFLLLCSPIVHFWYLAWILPLTTLRPSFGWTVASLTSAGYFLAWYTEAEHGWWGYGHLAAAAFWLPAIIAFASQHRQLIPRLRYHLKNPSPPATGDRLGIVIPTLKLSSRLSVLVETLRAETGTGTPVVIAGTSDTPVPLPGVETATAPKGRGDQIAAGIAMLDTDWILIAHADTIPRPGWHTSLLQAIHRHPDTAMFVLGQRFDRTTPGTLFVEILNELRVVFGGVAFGDQTMVIRRTALENAGGFPAQPLMEDVEASLRLHTRGRILYLGQEWRVSSEKWHRAFPLRFFTVLRLVATYQLARLRSPTAAAVCARRQYEEYYN